MKPYFEQRNLDHDKYRQFLPFSCIVAALIDSSAYHPIHWHNDIELIHVLEGTFNARINDEDIIAGPGDMILINSRDLHSSYVANRKTTKYHIIQFDPSLLFSTPKIIHDSKYILDFTVAKSTYQKLYKSDELINSNIPHLFNMIIKEFEERPIGFEFTIRAYICNIFVSILRNWHLDFENANSKITPSNINSDIINDVLTYIDNNFADNITSKQCSKLCNISYSHFLREFKKAIGKSFNDYLIQIRMTEAEKELLSSNKNITEIAFDTGFKSVSYFTYKFHLVHGVSPTQYRAKI